MFALVLAGIGGTAIAFSSAATPQMNYRGPIAEAAGSCLGVSNNERSSGQAVLLQQCSNSIEQDWQMAADGTIGNQGFCMAVTDTDNPDNAQVALRNCDSKDGAQLWQKGPDSSLVNSRTSRCLSAGSNPAKAGERVNIAKCSNADGTQAWHFAEASTTDESTGGL